jgi:ribosomal protein L37AE/L43A
LQHIIDCADTPLMRDVLAERDELQSEAGKWRNALDNAVLRERAIGDAERKRASRLAEALELADVLADSYGRMVACDGKFYAYQDARAALAVAPTGRSEHICPCCKVERADYEGLGLHLPECPNCGSTDAPREATGQPEECR